MSLTFLIPVDPPCEFCWLCFLQNKVKLQCIELYFFGKCASVLEHILVTSQTVSLHFYSGEFVSGERVYALKCAESWRPFLQK